MQRLTKNVLLMLLAGLMTLSFSVRALSQNTSGTLRGIVTDGQGSLIVGAVVTVTDAKGSTKAVTTNNAGAYVVEPLAPGEYVVRATGAGFAAFENSKLTIQPGTPTTLDITLTISIKEEVTVSSDTEVNVDPNNNMNQIVLSGEALNALPDDPDDLAAALSALGGTSSGLNQTLVNGFSGARLPSKELIREIRINQNPFSAIYDQPGFGRAEIFTKVGADKFRGQGFLNFNDESLNTRNPFSPVNAPFQARLYGGNMSGPIIDKKSSFFLDIERQEILDNLLINAVTLDPQFNIVPLRQVVSTPKRRTSFTPRVDYQFNPRHSLIVHYGRTHSLSGNTDLTSFSLPSSALSFLNSEHALQLSYTGINSSTSYNDVRFQFISSHREQVGDNNTPTINAVESFLGGGAQVGLASRDENRWELVDDFSWAKGLHSFRAGFRLRRASIRDFTSLNFNGRYTFAGRTAPQLDANDQVVRDDATGLPVLTSITSIEQYRRTLAFGNRGLSPNAVRAQGGGATQFFIATGNPQIDISQFDVAGFFQSDWRVRPYLTLSFGTRYERQTNIDSKLNFAPRVAFVWAPGSGGRQPPKSVLRGGIGVFYDRFSENLTLHAERYNGQNQSQFIVAETSAQGIEALNSFPNVPSIESLRSVPGAQTFWSISDDLQAPYMIVGGIGLERRLPLRVSLTTYYVQTRRFHDLRARNINAPDARGVRPFGDVGNMFEIESSGVTKRHELIVQARYIGKKLTFFTVYVLAQANNSSDGPFSFPANSYDLTTGVRAFFFRRAPVLHLYRQLRRAVGTEFQPVCNHPFRSALQHHDRNRPQPGRLVL